jgi:hypothetical protein
MSAAVMASSDDSQQQLLDIAVEPASSVSSADSDDDDAPICVSVLVTGTTGGADCASVAETKAPTKAKRAATGVTAAEKKDKAKSSKTTKPKKLTQADATAMVAAWFRRENKPTMPVTLVAALGSRVSKAQCQTALNELLADGTITSRDIKKAIVYFANQDSFRSLDPVEAMSLKEQLDNTRAALLRLEAESRDLAARELSLAVVTNDELRAKRDALAADVDVLQSRLGPEPHQAESVDPAAMAAAVKCFTALRQAWTLRRRLAMDVVEGLAMDRRPADVMAELGIEPDPPEDAAFASRVRVPRPASHNHTERN